MEVYAILMSPQSLHVQQQQWRRVPRSCSRVNLPGTFCADSQLHHQSLLFLLRCIKHVCLIKEYPGVKSNKLDLIEFGRNRISFGVNRAQSEGCMLFDFVVHCGKSKPCLGLLCRFSLAVITFGFCWAGVADFVANWSQCNVVRFISTKTDYNAYWHFRPNMMSGVQFLIK